MNKTIEYFKEKPGSNYAEVEKKFNVDKKCLCECSLDNRDLDAKVGQKPIFSVKEEKTLASHSLEKPKNKLNKKPLKWKRRVNRIRQ